jgi:hypothetical protein
MQVLEFWSVSIPVRIAMTQAKCTRRKIASPMNFTQGGMQIPESFGHNVRPRADKDDMAVLS